MTATPAESTQRAYGTAEVAAILGLSEKPWVVRHLIRTGKLRARNTGKSYIIPVSAVEEYLAGGDDPIEVKEAG